MSSVGNIRRDDSVEREGRLFSIGHSNVPFERLLELLDSYQIDVVADVRSHPYSKFSPQFNFRNLQYGLRLEGIGYVPLGAQLGGRPADGALYDQDGYVLYGQVASSAPFRAGLSRMVGGARRFRVAMLCSEEDPAECHRFLLITRVLYSEGIRVGHIRGDGTLQDTEDVRTYADWSSEGEQPALFDGPAFSSWRSARPVSRPRWTSGGDQG